MGKIIIILLMLVSCSDAKPKPTPIGDACRVDEDVCAGGAGLCVYWDSKLMCRQRCSELGFCPKGTLPYARANREECYCE